MLNDSTNPDFLRRSSEATMMRCLKCGSSRIDFEWCKCLSCGAAAGLRDEQCYVTEETKKKLWHHAEDLEAFGVTLEKQEVIGKSIDPVGVIGLALARADSLNGGVLRKLVLYLRTLEIPGDEILRLRLAEPEAIIEILDGREEANSTAQ